MAVERLTVHVVLVLAHLCEVYLSHSLLVTNAVINIHCYCYPKRGTLGRERSTNSVDFTTRSQVLIAMQASNVAIVTTQSLFFLLSATALASTDVTVFDE